MNLWRLRLFSFCGYGLALAALALRTATPLGCYGLIAVKMEEVEKSGNTVCHFCEAVI